jgi:hypothetical protein
MVLSKFMGWVGARQPTPAAPVVPLADVAPKPSVIDLYLKSAPSPQAALDIFQGEWSSQLPAPWQDLKAGNAGLFDDARITWLAEQVGGLAHQSVLELGPLEAGHTYMMEKLGAAEIMAVESNTHAFLKCLIIKEILKLERSRFLCGDFIEFLRQLEASSQFQLCVASGVLYHMQNPAELIGLLANHCAQYLFIWTHYYDAEIVTHNPGLQAKLPTATPSEYEGFKHTLHRYEYQAALEWSGFCGGSAPISAWMTRADIFGCLEHFGFTVQAVNFDHPEHANGPALALVAKRR